MKFEYQMDQKDEKTFYLEKHKKTNRIYILFFTTAYFILLFSFTKNNFFLSITIYIIFVILLYLLLYITNLLFTNLQLKFQNKNDYLTYTFILNEKGITQKYQSTKIEIEWKDVKKIVLGKKYSIVYSKKNNIAFLFRKEVIKDYDMLFNLLKAKK